MSFNLDAIQATEGIVDNLGEPVSFTPAGGSETMISGIFEIEPVETSPGTGVMTNAVFMSVKKSDGPFNEGDQFVIDSITYGVFDTEEDQDGLITCLLERRS